MNKVSTYVTCKMSLDIHVKAFVRFFKRLVSQHLNILFFILDLPLLYINGQPNLFLVCEFFVRFELESIQGFSIEFCMTYKTNIWLSFVHCQCSHLLHKGIWTPFYIFTNLEWGQLVEKSKKCDETTLYNNIFVSEFAEGLSNETNLKCNAHENWRTLLRRHWSLWCPWNMEQTIC
jgi:hypothetical protein